MPQNTLIKVPVTMNEQEFRSFALFDTFIHKRRLFPPLLFALIMCGFASVCFVFHNRAPQADLLGVVLLIIGIGLPVVYFSNFLNSVKAQAARMKLGSTPIVYTLTFSDKGFTASNPKEKMHYSWDNIQRIYSRKKCTYIYTDSNRAYLLPHRLTAAQPAVSLLERMLPLSVRR